MHPALEELLPDDGVDDDHEEDQQGNVEQGHHGLDDGVQDDLEACTKMKGEEVSHFLNSFGCTLYPCQPTNKQPLKSPLPREEGHRCGGLKSLKEEILSSTHHESVGKGTTELGSAEGCFMPLPLFWCSHPGCVHMRYRRRSLL